MCNHCHSEPLWTEPGWNMQVPRDLCIDSFQADAPDRAFRTSPRGGLFTHQKGGYYHDGRFATLLDVVNHYDTCMSLGLSGNEKSDFDSIPAESLRSQASRFWRQARWVSTPHRSSRLR